MGLKLNFSAFRIHISVETDILCSDDFEVFRNLGWAKIPFYPRDYIFSLRPTDPLLNNWFKVQPINLHPSRANDKIHF
uniref:Uncharacterized protein n=1 Tax=Cucumis melo TaxID=3656 RepID=A0A9I9EAX6_CUCME